MLTKIDTYFSVLLKSFGIFTYSENDYCNQNNEPQTISILYCNPSPIPAFFLPKTNTDFAFHHNRLD